MLRHFVLERLHDYRHEGYGAIENEAVYAIFWGGGNSGGNLPKGGNGGISQREVEQPGEHPCQLVWASFYHSLGDAIRAGSWGLPFSVCS